MSSNYREIAFESAIESTLLTQGGFTKADPEAFDRERGLDPNLFLSFVRYTQPTEWEYLSHLQGEKAESELLDRLCDALNSSDQGCLTVIRHGFKCFGKQFRAAFFAPVSGLNPETQQLYEANRLTVTRQLHYSTKHNKSLDLVLSLNGIPVMTAELKNPMTGQTFKHAENQYCEDRDPTELIFQPNKRTLVHFAIDPDEVSMTTRLEGKETKFLPFNLGNNLGAGNPENPDNYKTAYLWESVWQRNSLLDLLARFVHIKPDTNKPGRKRDGKKIIFPRYHQLDAVRKIEADARENGCGKNYLIEHSAGSGKSNTIGWLAYRLARLHNRLDEKIFDSVIVITDRLILDEQLQNTIFQFDHKSGEVVKIDENSEQLAKALRDGALIIITTLQKFPFVTEKVGDLPNRRYAVIIDEAHSSQGGESAAELRRVLSREAIREQNKTESGKDDWLDTQDIILQVIKERGARQPNVSFFAFTATPKPETLMNFGTPGHDDKHKPFHLYSMRQAIEEGFILDVLKNYTTYKAYYRLVKAVEDNPKVDKRKAARALARFMSLHPHNIAQKTEVMIEHFRMFTRHRISGKAKAMVVTESRLHAVRYKQAFDDYIRDKGYLDLRTLVAFSGTVMDPDAPDIEYTEHKMNAGISGKALPERFEAEYHVLIVAEKYQTGFDQPLLHTMYVDKRLSGIQAVQTLSRLNRTCPEFGKEDTFVLDFVNDEDEIRESFQPFYEQTLIGEQADPKQLYDLQAKLDAAQVYYKAEVEEFCRVFYKPVKVPAPGDHARLNACIDPAAGRFRLMEPEVQEEYRKQLIAYRNLYSFLSQIIPFQDTDLEKLYSYIRFLLTKLPRPGTGPAYDFGEEVALKYYRLQKIREGSILLEAGKGGTVTGPVSVGTGAVQDAKIELSQLIDILNERFGTEFKISDQLFFDSIREDAIADPVLQQTARANTMENFGYVFLKALETMFIDRLERNEDIAARYLNEREFQDVVGQSLLKQVYAQIRDQSASTPGA